MYTYTGGVGVYSSSRRLIVNTPHNSSLIVARRSPRRGSSTQFHAGNSRLGNSRARKFTGDFYLGVGQHSFQIRNRRRNTLGRISVEFCIEAENLSSFSPFHLCTTSQAKNYRSTRHDQFNQWSHRYAMLLLHLFAYITRLRM